MRPKSRHEASYLGTPSRLLAISLLALVAVVSMATLACTSEDEIPELERRAQALNKDIMCPVCPGETIDQSQNALSVDMRAIVMDKLEQGWTDDQVKDFFVERYGPSVLLEPPSEGFSLAAWVIPPVVIVAAMLVLYLVMRTMRHTPVAKPVDEAVAVPLTDQEQDEYFRRIEAALDRTEVGSDGPADKTSDS